MTIKTFLGSTAFALLLSSSVHAADPELDEATSSSGLQLRSQHAQTSSAASAESDAYERNKAVFYQLLETFDKDSDAHDQAVETLDAIVGALHEVDRLPFYVQELNTQFIEGLRHNQHNAHVALTQARRTFLRSKAVTDKAYDDFEQARFTPGGHHGSVYEQEREALARAPSVAYKEPHVVYEEDMESLFARYKDEIPPVAELDKIAARVALCRHPLCQPRDAYEAARQQLFNQNYPASSPDTFETLCAARDHAYNIRYKTRADEYRQWRRIRGS